MKIPHRGAIKNSSTSRTFNEIKRGIMAKEKTALRLHIIKRGERWAVKSEGASKASKIYATKEQAASSARKSGKIVIVHKKDGTIQKWIPASK